MPFTEDPLEDGEWCKVELFKTADKMYSGNTNDICCSCGLRHSVIWRIFIKNNKPRLYFCCYNLGKMKKIRKIEKKKKK